VVIIEAMACGLPVITTNCGGPDEIVTPDNGILVPVEDPSALAAAIEKAANNPEVYDREGIRNYALQIFGEEAFLNRINRVYKSCI
jgi:glycosyltransferase involved in cell wall biosynthesis